MFLGGSAGNNNEMDPIYRIYLETMIKKLNDGGAPKKDDAKPKHSPLWWYTLLAIMFPVVSLAYMSIMTVFFFKFIELVQSIQIIAK